MKTTTLTAAILAVFFCAAAAAAAKGKPTFLDTLNQGREVVITDADFAATYTPSPTPEPAAAPSGHAPGTVHSRFMVQVLAGPSREVVEQEKNALAGKTELPISVVFDAPYFKLYVGEFDERGEAENCLSRMKRLGYSDAWIARRAVRN